MLEINKNTIILDSDGYWNFGEDQSYINYPIRFPTVTFALESTFPLDKAADAMRVGAGYLPMLPDKLSNDEEIEYDDEGWYNFYIGLNGWSNSRVDNSIMAVVQSPNADDDEHMYYIDLTEAEQMEIFKVIDEQLRELHGTSCLELLKESEKEMIEMEEYRAKHKEVE